MAATAEQLARSLTQDIAETQSRLDKWIEFSKSDLENLEGKHEKALQELEAERISLLAKQQELNNKAEEGQLVSRQDKEALIAIEAEISRLKAKEAELPKQLEEARERQEDLKRVLDGKKQELKEMKDKQGDYINDLTRGVLMYKHLGLDFERADDNKLRLIYTQIDPAHPSREFFFSVHVDDDDHYIVEECNPVLNKKLLEKLVVELNKNNDFSTFCKEMRKAFKASLKSN